MNITLGDFLKRYSIISNVFIDQFCGLYDNNINSKFKVDLETIANWLNTKKGKLKETLVSTYLKNIDYTVKKIDTKSVGPGGHNKELIVLTIDSFKRLCMLSRTKRAETVRTYFLQLEELIDKYKDYIIEGLERRNKQLENNQKPKQKDGIGLIYVLKSDKDIDGIYKIGKTKKFKQRLTQHQSSHPDDLEVILTFETQDIDRLESCLKLALKGKQYRHRKEFYEVDIDIIKELISGCESIFEKARSPPKKFKHTGGFFLYITRN